VLTPNKNFYALTIYTISQYSDLPQMGFGGIHINYWSIFEGQTNSKIVCIEFPGINTNFLSP
jgi:hypothetical protein